MLSRIVLCITALVVAGCDNPTPSGVYGEWVAERAVPVRQAGVASLAEGGASCAPLDDAYTIEALPGVGLCLRLPEGIEFVEGSPGHAGTPDSDGVSLDIVTRQSETFDGFQGRPLDWRVLEDGMPELLRRCVAQGASSERDIQDAVARLASVHPIELEHMIAQVDPRDLKPADKSHTTAEALVLLAAQLDLYADPGAATAVERVGGVDVIVRRSRVFQKRDRSDYRHLGRFWIYDESANLLVWASFYIDLPEQSESCLFGWMRWMLSGSQI